MSDFSLLPPEALDALAEAAREVQRCQRVLAKTGDTVISELLRGQDGLAVWDHYPPGDVYDAEFHAQYYFHRHPDAERVAGEHGHFHTFLRPLGMPAGIAPAVVAEADPDAAAPPAGGNDALSHLVGISVDAAGRPFRLFTTNRWVTGETWYAAEDVCRMVGVFAVEHARPSWPLNRWLSALVQLFRPQIARLLRERDAVVARHCRTQAAGPGLAPVLEDRALEILSQMEISVEEQVGLVEESRRARRRRTPVFSC